jgi:lysozyme
MSEWNAALDAADQELAKWLGPMHKARIGVKRMRRIVNNYSYDGEGLKLTEGFEGCRTTAYRDQRGVLTIGYGHTGADVVEGMTITAQQAATLLLSDVAAAVTCVNHGTEVAITQDEFDALVDFTFNVGRGNFLKSTLLEDLNASNFSAAAAQFAVWDEVNGQVNVGLVRRRAAEDQLFLRVA